jgi:hypothetical protein
MSGKLTSNGIIKEISKIEGFLWLTKSRNQKSPKDLAG